MNKQQEWIDNNPLLWKLINIILDGVSFVMKWLVVYTILKAYNII